MSLFDPHTPRDEKGLNLSHLLIVFSLYFGITLLFPSLILLFGRLFTHSSSETLSFYHSLPKPTLILLQLLLIFTVFSALLATLYKIGRNVRDEILFGHSEKRIKKELAKGAMSWLIIYPVVLLANLLMTHITTYFFGKHQTNQLVVEQLRALMSQPALFALAALVIVTIVPFIEELLFRGFLQKWLVKKIGARGGILLSSLFFASLHFSLKQGIANIELLFSLFLLSCFLGYLYEKEQNLFASIGLHATFNAMTVIFLMFGLDNL